MPCSSTVFECAGDEEMAETLFVEEEDEEGEDNVDHVHDNERVPSTSTMTTFDGGPSTSTTMTRQHEPARARVEATVEGEVISRREAPRHVQVDHPPSNIIGDLNERTTRSSHEIPSILLMLHLLLLLSPKILDTLFLTQIGLIPCMRSWKTLRETVFGS